MTATPHRIRTTLATVRALTAAVDTRLQPTLTRLTTELEACDGYPNTASGSDTGPPPPFIPAGPNASTSSTERAALTPDDHNGRYANGPAAALNELYDYLLTAAQALEIVCRECDRRTPGLSSVDISRLQCATIPKGVCHQWADPTRTDGMCIDHGRSLDTATRARRALRERVRYHTNGMRE